MAIGIQTHHRLPLPGHQTLPVSGRASESSAGSQPEPEPVEILSSAAVAHPPVLVQLNPPSTRARLQALLAGDPPSADPNTQGQVIPVTSVPRESVPAAAAEGFWTQFQSPELFDAAFIGATRARATFLLGAAAPAAAPVIPLDAAETETADETGDSDPVLDKLTRMVEMLMELTDGLSERGKTQLKRLSRFVEQLHQATHQLPRAGVEIAVRGPAARLLDAGFTFEIEVRQSVRIDATVVSLNANGVQAVRVEASSESVTRLRITVGGRQRSDPVVLDLDRDGAISLDDLDAGEGQRFDINADGVDDLAALAAGGDALLALDRNGNGLIDNGAELFGDRRGAANGLEELARLDANGDGRITRLDPVFGQLQAFFDADGDGRIGKSEFRPLTQFAVTSLNLNYTPVRTERADGNAIAAESSMEFADGSTSRMVDAELSYQ